MAVDSLRQCFLDGPKEKEKKKEDSPPEDPQRAFAVRYLTLTPTKGCLILLIYLGSGLASWTLFNHGFKGTRTVALIDALYFCVVTMTTVGYGDLVPVSKGAKLFTCAYVFVGFGLVGLVLGAAANYIVEKQQRALEKALQRQQEHGHGVDHTPHFLSKMKGTKHKVELAAALVVAILGVGVAALMLLEGLGFVDSLYSVCVTVTTLGYGDHAFKSTGGRGFAVVWILASTACVAQFMLYLAELVTEEKQFDVTKWVLHKRMSYKDFRAADIDKDNVVSAPEYVIYKLKELGKIDDGDVDELMQEFQDHVHHSRSQGITLNDIISS